MCSVLVKYGMQLIFLPLYDSAIAISAEISVPLVFSALSSSSAACCCLFLALCKARLIICPIFVVVRLRDDGAA